MFHHRLIIALCTLSLFLTYGCSENEDSTCPIDYLSVVNLLADEDYPTGLHQVVWPLDDQYGDPIPPGIYMAHMCAGGYLSTIQFQVMDRTNIINWKSLPGAAGRLIQTEPAPNGMYLVANGGTYYPGDTIAFSFQLTEPSHVRIGITGTN